MEPTVTSVLDKLGRVRVAKSLGVSVQAVSNAAGLGKFPSSWYLILSEMSAADGIDCPGTLFAMKRPERAA
jgi:hypothetical protein